MSEPVCVNTDYWKKSSSGNGVLDYAGQRPVVDVIKDVKQVLATIVHEDGYTAKENVEWISDMTEYEEGSDRLFPKGEPFAVMMEGGSEGYLIRIFAYSRSNNCAKLAIAIKYLSDRKFCYRIAETLNEALANGSYFPMEPPK